MEGEIKGYVGKDSSQKWGGRTLKKRESGVSERLPD
jgi:hypothetical protein